MSEFDLEPRDSPEPFDSAPGGESALTSSQLAIWAGQRLTPESPLYNMVFTLDIQGRVDVPAFRTALQQLIDTNDAMRMRIEERDGVPHRVIAPTLRFRLEEVDLSSEADPDEALRVWVEPRTRVPFALDAKLFDTALLKLSPDRFVWYLNQHHLMTDGWSVMLAYRRFIDFYRRAREGRTTEEVFPQFASYAEFELRAKERANFAKAARYWAAKLDAPFEATEFYGKPLLERSPMSVRVTCDVGAERSRKLRALAESDGFKTLTPDLSRFKIFLTGLFAYLHKINGRRDLAVLTPTHNRTKAEFKETIGPFIEIFPLHVAIDEDETFVSLFDKVRREVQESFAQARPGAGVTAASQRYDVLLNYVHSSFTDFDGLPMSPTWVHSGHCDPAHSMRVQVHDFVAAGEFGLDLDLNRGVFGEFGRSAAARHLVAVIDAFLDDPTQRIRTVDLTTTDERRDFYAPSRSVEAPSRTVVEEFEARVTETPDAVAVHCEGTELTYLELNQRANRLARYLGRMEIERDARVGVLLPRSPELVVALLGVLKAGGAYVPIDLAAPAARAKEIIDASGARVVLTTDGHFDDAPNGVRVVVLDREAEAIASESEENLGSVAPGDALAYVIFTSGSTGRPKGVMVEHRALMNYIGWAREYYLDGKPLDFALFSSIAFDLTVTSVFVPLTSGGRAVVYQDDDATADLAVLRVFDEDRVDVVKLTPAHLGLIRQQGFRPTRIKKLIVGGEDLKSELARAIVDLFGSDVEIHNEYGPTEATVGVVVHRFDPENESRGSVRIGRPIANTSVYLVDDHLNAVATGIAGEIAVAGDSLARGYLDSPELTAASFVDNPFGPGARMYLTGDIGRRLPSGEIAFVGRHDDQVKIRGARIELAEVEAAIERHQDIVTCVVAAIESRPDNGAPVPSQPPRFCTRCGLADNHPDARLDADGVCNLCVAYDGYRDQAQRYFKGRDDLTARLDEAKAKSSGAYDFLMLLSGGKDSTYALYQVVEMGFRPLVFSLDNGYISEGAKDNIRRAVDDLGLELVFGETPAMNAIFADSLTRFKNVCNGCFKTIYTLGMNLARERGIRAIVTGLSRGQIFETRLARFFAAGIFDPEEIDRRIVEARRAYHRVDDVVARSLDVEMFEDDEVFDRIEFIDFYRYTDVELDTMLSFLDERAPWIRPSDTGRSTNCLINETGIYVHKSERGFHNYALPYSWDVRLDHKTRSAALAELDDDIDEETVQRTLREVSYRSSSSTEKRLAAYFVPSSETLDPSEVRKFVADRLPRYMVPSHFVPLERVPLTVNGKLDRDALPSPDGSRVRRGGYVEPSNDRERLLAGIWEDVLSVPRVGVHDDFLDLGGDSILSIQIVARAARRGLKLTPNQLFEHPTVSELATACSPIAREVVPRVFDRTLALTPIQQWFFAQDFTEVEHWNQVVHLEASQPLEPVRLERAVAALHRRHEALRLRFQREGNDWRVSLASEDTTDGTPVFSCYDFASLSHDASAREMASTEADAHRKLDLSSGPIFHALYFDLGADRPTRLVLLAHHLVVDSVSWWLLIADLERLYFEASPRSPGATSWSEWAARLPAVAGSAAVVAEMPYWSSLRDSIARREKAEVDDGNASEPVVRHVSKTLTQSLMTTVPQDTGARVRDVLVTALAKCLRGFLDRDQIHIDLEAHGRDGFPSSIDVSSTVGWFAAIYPIVLDTTGAQDDLAMLKTTKETLHRVPRNGIGFGLLRYLGDDATKASLGAIERAPVLFNYLGEGDPVPSGSKLFRAGGRLEMSHGPAAHRPYDLTLDAFAPSGELEIRFGFRECAHSAADVDQLADEFMRALTVLVESCTAHAGAVLTPSDFPEAALSQESLDDLLEEFGEQR